MRYEKKSIFQSFLIDMFIYHYNRIYQKQYLCWKIMNHVKERKRKSIIHSICALVFVFKFVQGITDSYYEVIRRYNDC